MDIGIERRPPFGSNPTVGERGSDTLQRVLGAAMDVFAEVPYPDARVEQITENAGCSRPAFYQYFSSKDDVFWALATQLGEVMVAHADSLAAVTPDEEGLATLTAWMDDFMALHEEWAPVFRAFPEATRGDVGSVTRSGSIADHTTKRLMGAFDLPSTAANRRVVSSLVGVLIRCSFYAEAAPEGMSRRPLLLGLARLFHRVLAGPVEGVNFKRGRTKGRRRVTITAAVEPVAPPELRARGERTRAALLRAGAEVLPQRGYHEARVDDIVEVAGVSHGTFYRYFDSKDDFFRVLAQDASARLVEMVERLELDGSAEDLRVWLKEWFAAYEADGGVISTWQDMRTNPELVAFSQQIALSVFSRLEKLLDQRDFGHPQVGASILLALLERAPYRVYVLGFSTATGEVESTLTIIRRGFLGIEDD
ncbi:MAG: TetR/AcrR family transcriptional regulator [Microthrixaceae bacterium]